MDRYFFRYELRRLAGFLSWTARRLAFEISVLQSGRELWTPAGRRFIELGLLVRSYLQNRIAADLTLGAEVASQLLNVLKHCDTITYNDRGTADAYALLHFLDRYHRFQLTYAHLYQNGLIPLKKVGIDVLDVGTGPGPSMFAVSDFYSERLERVYTQHPNNTRAFRIDYVEQSGEFDLPLNFHPAAIRASANVTPFGAVSVPA